MKSVSRQPSGFMPLTWQHGEVFLRLRSTESGPLVVGCAGQTTWYRIHIGTSTNPHRFSTGLRRERRAALVVFVDFLEPDADGIGFRV